MFSEILNFLSVTNLSVSVSSSLYLSFFLDSMAVKMKFSFYKHKSVNNYLFLTYHQTSSGSKRQLLVFTLLCGSVCVNRTGSVKYFNCNNVDTQPGQNERSPPVFN